MGDADPQSPNDTGALHPPNDVDRSAGYEIDDVAFIGRTMDEYERIFDLDLSEWTGQSVLDCPGGACAFVPEANTGDVDAVGVDMLYDTPPERLREKCAADVDMAIEGFDGAEAEFVWSYYDDVADVRDHWSRAYQTFIADYEEHFGTSRYVAAELPDLPFEDDSFSLVLSAHLLFLYSEDLTHEFHEQSLLELARVAAEEVRVYPLAQFDGTEYGRLDELRKTLARAGYVTERRTVPFEFQQGATEMLVIEI